MCLLEYFSVVYVLWLWERAKLHFFFFKINLELRWGELTKHPQKYQLTPLFQQYGIGLAKME